MKKIIYGIFLFSSILMSGCIVGIVPAGTYSTVGYPQGYYINNLPACGHWRVWGNGFLDCYGNWHPNQGYDGYYYNNHHRRDGRKNKR